MDDVSETVNAALKKIAEKKERVEYLRNFNDQVAAVDNSKEEIR